MQTCEIVVPKLLIETVPNKKDKPYSKISQLIQRSEFQKAQDLLFCVPENDEHWHYLNALVHFSISGDTIVSRTALARAMSIEPLTPLQLIADYPVEIYLQADADKDITPEKIEYWAITRPAWSAVDEAFAWLEDNCRHQLAVVNRVTTIIADYKGDTRRWERWARYELEAEKQFKKGEFELALKSYEKALEYAEQINYTYFPFTESMLWLVLLTGQTMKSTAALEERILNRAERLKTMPNDPLLALHFQMFGKLMFTIGKFKVAEKFFRESIDFSTKAISEERRPITLYEDLQIKHGFALTLFALQSYSEAIAQVLKNIAIKSLYLGSNHRDCADDYKLAFQIYTALDDKDGKNAMCVKLASIRDRQYHYHREPA